MSTNDKHTWDTLSIGLSGSSGAGKTTLTALLKQILPSRTVFIHADAFGKEFEDLPTYEGVLDADSRHSVRFDALKATIDHAKRHGSTPSDLYQSYDFIEADLAKARDLLATAFVTAMRTEIEDSGVIWDKFKTIVVVDGFLLYHEPDLRKMLDVKLLLRTTKEEARTRRFGRYGEKMLPDDAEEFWKTPRYFDQCVWRNYCIEHAFLFPNGDVEAVLREASDAAGGGVQIQPVPNQSIEETQKWAVRTLLDTIKRLPAAGF